MASTPPSPHSPQPPKRQLHPVAGILSYLVPGLGQIVQGRYAKGILFFVCISTLFFYGIYIGSGSVTISGRKYTVNSNVYLPTDVSKGPNEPQSLTTNLINRWQFVGQFWVGAAAWPAMFQYYRFQPAEQNKLETLYDDAARALMTAEKKEQEAQEAEKAGKDVADAREEAAAAQKTADEALKEAAEQERKLAHPIFGSFQREPSQASINAVHNAGDKRLELAWVFTVIAGVLNILVIYDAVAGPAIPASAEKKGG
jgi:hypothetical protein